MMHIRRIPRYISELSVLSDIEGNNFVRCETPLNKERLCSADVIARTPSLNPCFEPYR
jgi:hypothetical protein